MSTAEIRFRGVMLAGVWLAGLASAQPSPGDTGSVAPPPALLGPGVEPEVEAAFAAAWRRLPVAWQARVAGVRLVRRPVPDVPPGVQLPLATRLLLAGAHAQYWTGRHQIEVFDAALSPGPVWREPAPSPAELAAFLGDLADVLELPAAPTAGDAAALTEAWRRFAGLVADWPEAAGLQLDPDSSPGDPQFLTGFLRAAVARSLGGSAPPLDQLLLHELAHAVQLVGHDYDTRMGTWATVSDWRRARDGEPAQGMVGGGFRMEDPLVLIRGLLGAERGPRTLYVPGRRGNFVNPYMAYDLREDFAEAVRLLVWEPESLLRHAPEKLLATNALGLHGAGSSPGPLLRSADWLLAPSRRGATIEALRRIVAPRADEPVWASRFAEAVLQAHTSVWRRLEPAELPVVAAPGDAPDDLPPTVAAVATTGFDLTVHGRRLGPPERSLRRAWETAISQHDEGVTFHDEIWVVLVEDTAGAERFVRQEVLDELDPFTRLTELRTLWPHLNRVWSAERCERLARREVAWQRTWARHGHAELVARLAGLPVDELDAAARRSLAPRWMQAELAAAILRQQLEAGAVVDAAWLAQVDALPGNCWAARLRVRLLLSAAERSADPGARGPLLARARAAASAALLPELAARLELEVGRAADR